MSNIVFIVQKKKLLDIKRKAKEKQKLSHSKEEDRPTETKSMITKNIGVSTDFREAIINMLKSIKEIFSNK